MPKLDRGEKAIRFGCGFIFGLFVAFWVAAKCCFPDWTILFVVGGLIAGVVCGWLALKRGDRFWYSIRDKWYRW